MKPVVMGVEAFVFSRYPSAENLRWVSGGLATAASDSELSLGIPEPPKRNFPIGKRNFLGRI
jgi:hypothetical protein